MSLANDSLMYMIYHVFLPPKLPHTGDGPDVFKADLILLGNLLEALEAFGSYFSAGKDEDIQSVHSMIENLVYLSDDSGGVHEVKLLETFEKLSCKGGILPMFVNAQNAGLIVRKDTNSIIFEAFELSPPNNTVMTTKGRLRRYFPGPAMAVDLDTFNESGFQSTLAHTIAKMSHQVAAEMKPKANKAGQAHVEDRDTTNPKLVTEFLTSFLEAVGHPVSVPRIWKNTREEVLWSSGLVPWRRSSVWLLTRVAIQVAFSRSVRVSDYYKEFMIFFMARILDVAREQKTSSELLHCLTCKISRRLRKLEPRLERYWLPTVEDILLKTVQFIEVRWNEIIETFDPDIQTSTLATPNFTEDAVAQLPELEEQINLINYPPKGESHTGFSRPPLLAQLPPDVLPTVQPSTESNVIYLLAAFETWIASEPDN